MIDCESARHSRLSTFTYIHEFTISGFCYSPKTYIALLCVQDVRYVCAGGCIHDEQHWSLHSEDHLNCRRIGEDAHDFCYSWAHFPQRGGEGHGASPLQA